MSGSPISRRSSSGVQSKSTETFMGVSSLRRAGCGVRARFGQQGRGPPTRSRPMPTIAIDTLDHRGKFDAYLAEPGGGASRGAIVVIQEIFGINEGIRRKCDKLAAEGYLAIAPDLFWRIEPGVQLDPDVPDQLQR